MVLEATGSQIRIQDTFLEPLPPDPSVFLFLVRTLPHAKGYGAHWI